MNSRSGVRTNHERDWLAWVVGPGDRGWHTPTFWLLLIIVAAVCFRVYYLVRPLEWVISMFSADDFFYYLNTAWNIREGFGASCDQGLTHHNGFHPLFLVLLLVCALAGASKAALVYCGYGILIGALVAAMTLSYRIGALTGSRWLALCVPVVLGFNTYFVRATFHGFETLLLLAMVLAVVLAVLTRRPAWEIGLWLGLAVLARIDTGILAIPVAVQMARDGRWRAIVTTGAVSAIVVSPWAIWSWLNFGSLTPLSGAMKVQSVDLQNLWAGLEVMARGVAIFMFGSGVRDYLSPVALLAAGLAFALLAILGVARRQFTTGWIFLYVVLAWTMYSTMTNPAYDRQLVRYLVPAIVSLLILALAALRRSHPLVPLVVLVIIAGTDARFVQWADRAPVLQNFVSLSQTTVPEVLDQIAEDQDVVGCFDSGALGYFADRPVVNLDGLTNAEVVSLLTRRDGRGWIEKYRQYLHDKGITILVGGTSFFWPNYFPDWGSWEELAPRISTADLSGEIVFLRVPPAVD